VAVAEELNFTRAAERLHMAQPPLSAAIRQLEQQLETVLLERTSRQVELTEAGRVLLERGRKLLAEADATFAAVREVQHRPAGRLTVGLAPTARFELAPAVLRAWAERVPGVMLYPREDTTGALVRDVRHGRVDLAVAFCAPATDGLARERLRDAPAVVHLPDTHPLAARERLELEDLRDQTLLVAGGPDSRGYTETILALCRAAGFEPRTAADPYPDLGLQAVREGVGVVVYVRSAFSERVEGSAFVPLDGVTLPFDLVWAADRRSGALEAILDAARALRDERGWSGVS
jgi:DNA-binding transcriptional LysR family regulator